MVSVGDRVYLAWKQNGPELTISCIALSQDVARDKLIQHARADHLRREIKTARLNPDRSWQMHTTEGTFYIDVMEVQ